MKVGLLFTVRLGSTRLPGKAILPAQGKPLIWYLIKRFQAEAAQYGDGVVPVICTTTLIEDRRLDDVAKDMEIAIYHGNPENVPRRQFDCANEFSFTHIVNLDCDDILCATEPLHQVITLLPKFDVVSLEGFPLGSNFYAASTSAVERVLIQYPNERLDTGWGELFRNNDALSVATIYATEEDKLNARLTVDYEEDYKMVERVIEALDMKNKIVKQKHILTFLKDNPDVVEMNLFLNEIHEKDYNSRKILR